MKLILTISIAFIAFWMNAQTGINTRNPNTASIFHVESTDKGVLLPRIQLQSKISHQPLAAIPPNGTMVFNISVANSGANKIFQGFYIWDTNQWKRPLTNVAKPIIQFTQLPASTIDFNSSTVGVAVDIFGTQKFAYDGAASTYTKLSNTQLQINDAGLYQITINLALKEASPTQNSTVEFYVTTVLGSTEIERMLSRVPQWRYGTTSNIQGRFDITYTAYVQATANQILTLKAIKFNTGGAVNFDSASLSSITLVKIK